MMLWETIFCGFWAFGLVFIACEMGQKYSNGFNEIGKTFAEIDWYLLPEKTQRMLVVILIYLQEPNDFRFFGNISTSRTQFQKVRSSFHSNHLYNSRRIKLKKQIIALHFYILFISILFKSRIVLHFIFIYFLHFRCATAATSTSWCCANFTNEAIDAISKREISAPFK